MSFQKNHNLRLATIVVLAVVGCFNTRDLHADEFQVSLKNDGSTITVEIDQSQTMSWTDVLDNGEMSTRKISFSKIRQLILSESPASEQVANIKGLLTQLAGDNWADRETSEQKLSDSKIGGPFRKLIESQADHPVFEVRYRIERILSKLDSQSSQNESEFDTLIMADGSEHAGDAGEFNLKCVYRGKKVSFQRAQLSMIANSATKVAMAVSGKGAVKTELFHDHRGAFFLPAQTTVDFEKSPSGLAFDARSDVSEKFVAAGLKMGTEVDGFVGISGYGFKYAGLPPSGNSICVFEEGSKYPRRFRGIMNFQFCVPNQPSVAAGVHEFGLFIARVNHSRDMILEAYNADGQLLACVESTDQHCVFSGVKSNELITRVRILSNPHLFRVDRAIDEDYAVDNVCFSEPVAVNSDVSGFSNPEKKTAVTNLIRLRNGDAIKSSDLKLSSKNALIALENQEIEIGLDEIASIQFPNKLDPPDTAMWKIMLEDQSMIHVLPDAKGFTSTSFNQIKATKDQISALWISKNPLRYPLKGDFKSGQELLVFPTCRIVDRIQFNNEGFSWDESAVKLQQPIFTGKEDPKDEEDPTPPFTNIKFTDPWPENVPSVWFNEPQKRDDSHGRLRLTDGQQLTLGKKTAGESSRFQFVRFEAEQLIISVDGKTAEVPFNKVLSIELPQNK